MKLYVAVVTLFLGLGVARTQQSVIGIPSAGPANPPSVISPEEWRLLLVARLISLPSPVTTGAVQLHGMGDEAAVDIVKLLGASSKPALAKLTSAQLLSALDVVHMAFEKPKSIAETVNCKPQAALFLMRYFAGSSSDETVQSRIAKEIAFLEAVQVSPAPTQSAPKQ